MNPKKDVDRVHVVSFERQFKLWEYRVGHSSLLLRSPADDGRSDLVDVVFKSVDALCLPVLLNAPSIFAAPLDSLQYGSLVPFPIGHVGFWLSGPGWQGWVRASSVHWYHSTKSLFAPSGVMEGDGEPDTLSFVLP